MKHLSVLTLVLLLTACATEMPRITITMSQIRSANYGAYPKHYEKQIRQHLAQNLFDYDSAKIQFIMPPKKTYKVDIEIYRVDGSTKSVNMVTFYSVCVNINAKNQYGGYTGWKTYRYEINTDTGRFKQYDFATYDCKDAMESEDIWIVNYSEKVDIIR